MHVLFKIVHEPNLIPSQEMLLVLRHFKHYCCYSIPPLVEQIFLVFLDVHQLMHNMELHIKLTAIDGVLRRVVEVVLDAAGGELLNLIQPNIFLLFLGSQIRKLCRIHVAFLIK